MKKIIILVCMTGAVACSGGWYFEAGPSYRGNMKISTDGGSRAASEGVNAARAGTVGNTVQAPAAALPDDGTAQILRTFDDGFVGPSGTPWMNAGGWTQLWGYEDDAQYSAVNDELTFTRTVSASDSADRTVTRVTSGAAGWSGSEDVDGAGAQFTMGYVMMTKETFELSGQLQFGFLDGIDSSSHRQAAYSQQVDWTTYRSSFLQNETWTYTYDTLGNPSFPPAPYSQTDPAPSGGEPLIVDRPDSITQSGSQATYSDQVVGRGSRTAVSYVDMTTESSALVLQGGPRLSWKPTPRFALLVQPAVSLNFLDAEVKRNESFEWSDGTPIRTWQDDTDKQAWLLGAGISAGVHVDLTDRIYVMADGGYDWVDTCDIDVGGDTVRVDLSGYRLGAALGFRL